ncbi:hypothetical protein HUT19_03385 [Streptomyces sp. NA02950]|uniref:hypothetical protein n=1 Tax=Streptomyces sp. NA02950 TaxID=2742137 RepID=UPI001590C427|nr:hypothetical protein [Streptomyces sp. NA02950]QKV90899.1 hypothetical protein HUT19_03385 [Streptomyces sp. NA02950]
MSTLERQDEVFVLDLGDTENRFHPDWLASVGALPDDALAAAIVDRTADEQGVREAAIDIAGPLAAKAGPTLGRIKTRRYGPAIEALRQKDIPLGRGDG